MGEWRVIKHKMSQDIKEFGITAMFDKQTRKQSTTIFCCCCYLAIKSCLTLAAPWTIACQAGRDWGQEEKGMTEDEMAGWHH